MPQNTHVKSFLEMLVVERGVIETTRHSYRRTLLTLDAFLVSRGRGIEDAQAEDIQAYLASLADAGLVRSTVGQRLSTLRQFYRFLFREGLRSDDPVAVIDGPRPGLVFPEALGELPAVEVSLGNPGSKDLGLRLFGVPGDDLLEADKLKKFAGIVAYASDRRRENLKKFEEAIRTLAQDLVDSGFRTLREAIDDEE